MTDKPIAYTAEGRPLFDNTPTVVAVMVPSLGGIRELLVVRRNNMPGKGLLGLPGGYHMRGESWQEAGAREVREETGWLVNPTTVRLAREPLTDEYGNNLLIAQCSGALGFTPGFTLPDETQAVLWLHDAGSPDDWAFPLHYEAAREFFEGRPSRRMDDRINDQ